MKTFSIYKMVRGWFCGDFEPTAYSTKYFEVGVKVYRAGDKEPFHTHKIATEITLILTGRARMNGVDYFAGDIIIIEPGEGTDFEAIWPTTNVVIKTPSVAGDKYVGKA